MRRIPFAILCLSLAAHVACGPSAQNQEPGNNASPNTENATPGETFDPVAARGELRQILSDKQIDPLEMPETQDEARVELGRMLFFEPEQSGNRDVACSTCHRPENAMVDGLPLPAGTLARVQDNGVRLPGPELKFVARNVPDIFNRGHKQTRTMFWDVRVQEVEVEGEMRFVLFDKAEAYGPENYLRVFPEGLDSILAAQNMLPVLNRDELRGANGHSDIFGEANELATVGDLDFESSWRMVMERLVAIPEYVELFQAAYPGVTVEQLQAEDGTGYVYAANAISAFIIQEFTFNDSPWDEFVAGKDDALTDQQVRGALVFYSDKARCGACHTGELFTDQHFHNIGVIPLGSGPASEQNISRKVDRGVTHRAVADATFAYSFRTPPLRNVELTGPYMHNGTYNTLEQVIRHKDHAAKSLFNYNVGLLPEQFQPFVHLSVETREAVKATLSPLMYQPVAPEDAGDLMTELYGNPLGLTDGEVSDLVAFLESLTSPSARDLEHVRPEYVPSGLDMPDPTTPSTPVEQ